MILNDVDIQKNVLEELDWSPSVNVADVAVTVKSGVVTLGGFVRSFGEKHEAEKIVMRMKGVKGVANDIQVRLSTESHRSDSDLASAAIQALRWNVFVPDESIKVKVEKGWVTLQGEVEWNYQRERAAKVVRPLIGVHGVTNQITVHPRVSPVEIKEKIRKSLDRLAMEDANRIFVTTSGNEVTLSGSVSSWAEREQAEHAAWAAPGVSQVRNTIAIKSLAYA